jgi:hypothetical protein
MQFLAEQHLEVAKLLRQKGKNRTGEDRERFIRKSNSFVICVRPGLGEHVRSATVESFDGGAVGTMQSCLHALHEAPDAERSPLLRETLRLYDRQAKANGYDLPIDLEVFSTAIMSGRPHAEVHLQFGRHEGIIGRSNLHCWTTDPGKSVLAAWLYELDTIAVSVHYVQAGKFRDRRDLWHPHSRTSAKRFLVADFMYSKRSEAELSDGSSANPGGEPGEGG